MRKHKISLSSIQTIDRQCRMEALFTGYDKKIFLALHTENKTTEQTLFFYVHSELVQTLLYGKHFYIY